MLPGEGEPVEGHQTGRREAEVVRAAAVDDGLRRPAGPVHIAVSVVRTDAGIRAEEGQLLLTVPTGESSTFRPRQ